MRSRHLTQGNGLGEGGPLKGPAEWNASLISRRPVRPEYLRDETETDKHCQHRIAVAMAVFLLLLGVLSAVALWLLSAKIDGTLTF